MNIVDDAVTRIGALEIKTIELVVALKNARHFIVVACGETSPYARLALANIDQTLAKAESH